MELLSRDLDCPTDRGLDAIQDWFHHQDLSDGLPVVPPTPERVERMVAGSGRDPGDEVGIIDPKRGVATIEKLAVNAVMAGCLPSYMPVIVAAMVRDVRSDLQPARHPVNHQPGYPSGNSERAGKTGTLHEHRPEPPRAR